MTTKVARPADYEEFLTPGEVAELFRVDPKTVTRWAHQGRLSFITTPGGHKRFPRSEVEKYLQLEVVQSGQTVQAS